MPRGQAGGRLPLSNSHPQAGGHNSFFEAQEQFEGLDVRIVEGCNRIRELKETIRILDSDLVDSARQIQERNSTRSNLLVLQQKLRLILNVNHALSAFKLARY